MVKKQRTKPRFRTLPAANNLANTYKNYMTQYNQNGTRYCRYNETTQPIQFSDADTKILLQYRYRYRDFKPWELNPMALAEHLTLWICTKS